jgi:hypothetical protein
MPSGLPPAYLPNFEYNPAVFENYDFSSYTQDDVGLDMQFTSSADLPPPQPTQPAATFPTAFPTAQPTQPAAMFPTAQTTQAVATFPTAQPSQANAAFPTAQPTQATAAFPTAQPTQADAVVPARPRQNPRSLRERHPSAKAVEGNYSHSDHLKHSRLTPRKCRCGANK